MGREAAAPTTVARRLRFRLRSLLVLIALLALGLAFLMQTVRLQQAALREARLNAELLRERDRAEANLRKARLAVDQLYTEIERRLATETANKAAPGSNVGRP